MRMTTWVFLGWVAAAGMLVMPFLYSEGTVKSGIKNTEYANRLSSACHAGVQATDAEPAGLAGGAITGIWNKKKDRDASLAAFQRTLDYSFLMGESTDNDMEIRVPITILVDNDGYYMTYNALFDPSASAGEPGVSPEVYRSTFNNESQNGEFRTWAEPVGATGWTIRYCLNDYIFLISPNGRIFRGFRSDPDMHTEIIHDTNYSMSLHNFLWPPTEAGKKEYIRHKTDKIIDDIQTNLQYFANEKNYYSGLNGDGYDITMPTVAGEDWHRLLENPTMLAFLQGKNTRTGATEINTYSYSGGEMIPADRYFIIEEGGKKIYHSLRYEMKLSSGADHCYFDNTSKKYKYKGSIDYTITELLPSMEDCAMTGAYPCNECIRSSTQK